MADQAAIDEVRALLRSFVRSDLKSCHIVGPRLELFLSRDQRFTARGVGAAPPAGRVATLTAPHLGTLLALSPVGDSVAAGSAYGTIGVLDETRDLIAERTGTVTAHCHAPGALVEFGEALVDLVEAP